MIHKIAEDMAGDFSGMVRVRSKEGRKDYLKQHFDRYADSEKRKKEQLQRLFGKQSG